MNELIHRAFTLLREVKSVSVATVNDGKPEVRIADVMLAEEDGLYFITARGKPYYKQLKENSRIALCAMDKNYVTMRITGNIQFCNDDKVINKIFESNPIMETLYPDDKKDILEAFHLHKGQGEIFDLSTEPPKRERFAFGGETVNPPGFIINDKCTACGTCLDACPVGVISEGDIYSVDGSHCLECGRCAEVCPEDAIEQALGM
jgi:uncharacterized pyridoxamine 5'-phosphate oxidase family protein